MLDGGTQLLKSRQVNCKDGITNVQSDYTYNPLPTDLFVVPNHEFDLFCAIFSTKVFISFIWPSFMRLCGLPSIGMTELSPGSVVLGLSGPPLLCQRKTI